MNNLRRFKKARDLGASYILTQINVDGSFGNVDLGLAEYYKVPAALHCSGHDRAASLLCDWIRKKGIQQNGDFGPRPTKLPDLWDYGYLYYNIWVVLGAQKLGYYDLSERGMNFLSTFWDSISGGFYCHPNIHNEKTKQDLWVVAGCGIAALATSRMKESIGVAKWMDNLMELQPDYPDYLYSTYSRAEGLIINPNIRYRMYRGANEDQFFFHPGIAGGFLASIYMATNDRKWLDLSIKYMDFVDNASDFLFDLPRSGKVGWAASLLYTITGDNKYKKIALRVGDILIGLQSDLGYWTDMNSSDPNNDVTAELTYWLNEIHKSVGEE